MKKSQSKKEHKGFYAALGVCILAIAAAVYIGINGMMNRLNEDQTLDLSEPESTQSEKTSDWNYPSTKDITKDTTKEVTKPESDIPTEQPKTEVSMAEQVVNPVQEQPIEQTQATALQFMMPLEGEILNPFSNGDLVKSKTLKEWRTHDGVDVKAVADTPVKCIADGTIEEIKEDPMWGVCISVAHTGNYVSYYYGLKPNIDVKVGQEVKVGDVLGAVGNTTEIEIAEDSHLHFGVKKEGVWIDPMSLMAA